jgi:hypothetical protein
MLKYCYVQFCDTFEVQIKSTEEERGRLVARIESLKGRMGETARQAEGLFESLLAEAFRR